MEGILSKKPLPPLWKFQSSFIHCTYLRYIFWSCTTPPPPISSPYCGGSKDIFWNCTMYIIYNLQQHCCILQYNAIFYCHYILLIDKIVILTNVQNQDGVISKISCQSITCQSYVINME